MALSMGLGMLLFMALSMRRALSMVLGGCTCQCLTYKATLNRKIYHAKPSMGDGSVAMGLSGMGSCQRFIYGYRV